MGLVRVSVVAVVGLSLLLSQAAPAQFESAGSVQSYQTDAAGVELQLSTGAIASVRFLESSIAQVRVNRSGSFSPRVSEAVILAPGSAGPVVVNESVGALWVSSPALTFQIHLDPFGIVAFDSDGFVLSADANPAVAWESNSDLMLTQRFALSGESYFGLGQRGGPIDRRGRRLLMRNTDEFAYGEFQDPHYQSYPMYYAVREGRCHGVFLDSPAFSFFDVAASDPAVVSFGTVKGELSYYMLAGPAPSDVAKNFAKLTGTNPLPALWTLGYHHSRYGWMTRDEVLGIASQMRAQNIPCDVIWFDIDHMDSYHHFTWDPVRFPDPVSMLGTLHGAGYKAVCINEPCVVTDDPLWPALESSGFVMKDTFGATVINTIFLGTVGWLDFSKSAVRAWYRDQLKSFMSTGVDGIWNDLNEPAANTMPLAIHEFDGDPRLDDEARNVYALIENRMVRQAQLELRPNVRPFILSRSGYSGVHRYAATWSGDTLSTFDALRVSVQMTCSMGLSGINQFGHDVGGFLGSPNAELFVRWLQFGAWIPFFRNHSIDTSDAREPWMFGDAYTPIIRRTIEERYRLLPWFYSLFEISSRTGLPIVAPTVFHFPEDEDTRGQDTEFLVGGTILVAPVIEAGATSRSVYLPAGADWYDVMTGRRYGGGRVITVPVDITVCPTFARDGAIVVRSEVRQFVDTGVNGDLQIDCYPGRASLFDLYEDDGRSFDYVAGDFVRTRIRAETDAGSREITLQRIEGALSPPARNWTIHLHDVRTVPTQVMVNGNSIPRRIPNSSNQAGWWYDADAGTVIVRLSDDAKPINVEVRIPTRRQPSPDAFLRSGSMSSQPEQRR